MTNKIVEGLKDAVAGNYARVTIDGVQWIREDWAEATKLRAENSRLRAALEHVRKCPDCDGNLRVNEAIAYADEQSAHDSKSTK